MFSRFLPRKSVVWETFFWELLQPKSCYRSGLLNPPNVINVVIKNVKNVVTKNVPQFIYKTHRKSHESHFYYSCRLGGLQLNQRRDPSTGIFLWILGYFWEHHFSRTLSGNSFYRYYLKHQIVGFFFFLLTIPMFIYWSFISLGLCFCLTYFEWLQSYKYILTLTVFTNVCHWISRHLVFSFWIIGVDVWERKTPVNVLPWV